MKKLIITLSLLIGFTSAINAQTEKAANKLGIGAEFALPIGSFGLSNTYNIGYGIAVQGEHGLSKALKLTASTGYLLFEVTESITNGSAIYTEVKKNYGAVPLKVGGKYYLGNFYGAAEVGAVFGQQLGGTALAYHFGIGISVPVTKKSALDFSARIEEWDRAKSGFPFIALRAAYAFGL